MTTKFTPPPFALNNVDSNRSTQTYNNTGKPNIIGEVKKLVNKNYTPNIFENTGQMNAVVLEVRDPGDPSLIAWKDPLLTHAFYGKKSVPDVIEVRYRVPELHAHIPNPESDKDWARINLHPIAIMKKEKGMPEVGDIVRLDFTDKNNFTGAIVVETLNTNENPNAGGNCSPSDMFNTAPPDLNLTQPTGDSQDSAKSEYGAFNDPAGGSFVEGIEYLPPPSANKAYEYLKNNMYVVSLQEYSRMNEFGNLDTVADALFAKNVFSICFTIAEDSRLLRDTKKLKNLIIRLRKSGISCSIAIHESIENINAALIHASSILKEAPYQGIYWRIPEGISYRNGSKETHISKTDQIFRRLADSKEIKYGAIFTEKNHGLHSTPTQQDITYLADNHYNYLERNDDPPFDDALYKADYPTASPAYFLGGINLLYSPDEPCVNGFRTKEILETELDSSVTGYVFLNYKFLTSELSELITDKTSIIPVLSTDSAEKQNLLNSVRKIVKPLKADINNIMSTPSTPTKAAPTFNSDEVTSQSSSPVAPVATPAVPGSACSTVPGSTNALTGPGSVVSPPSFRFDSIENYKNLGWVANDSAAINDVIYDFMQRFSAAVYRRIPPTHPVFSGSLYKKIRLTSTARTTAKQVELMWDKIKNGGEGDRAVYKLYGNKDWTRAVVEAYHSNNQAAAIQAVEARLAAGGGSAHLSGKGVDIHTYSHINAEGLNSSNMSIAGMKNTKFVRAVVEACAEAGARPTVEAYQQHVHITIH